MPKRKRFEKEQHIVIVGAGLAGLSAAISLEQAGFGNITIVERDENFDIQREGYGLTLTYNPKGPLASLGILEEVAQRDCPSRSHYMFRPDGSILGYFGNSFSCHRGRGQRGNLRIPRKTLRRILFRTVSKATRFFWGHRLVGYKWDEPSNQYKLNLESSNGEETTIFADLLVAADGVRSAVIQKMLEHPNLNSIHDEGNSVGRIRRIGIRLILGIAEFSHPLLTERGFYTLDGKHRLFTMPYQSDRFGDTNSRIMWQLSFPLENTESKEGSLDASALRDYVLRTCKSWHNPVFDMIQSTPLDTIWGTDLMDRDPWEVWNLVKKCNLSRIVVVGDALHSMSPFKGQGANQALTDGPLLAMWLQRASIDSAVTGFWRETVQRTAPVVAASRLAARELHSPAILKYQSFAGVDKASTSLFLSVLAEKNIGANLGDSLDAYVLKELNNGNLLAVEPQPSSEAKHEDDALKFASRGDTQSLRLLSLAKCSISITTAKDASSRTCLHLAALGGHEATCKWLLTELDFDVAAKDLHGLTAKEYASKSGSKHLMHIFSVIEMEKNVSPDTPST